MPSCSLQAWWTQSWWKQERAHKKESFLWDHPSGAQDLIVFPLLVFRTFYQPMWNLGDSIFLNCSDSYSLLSLQISVQDRDFLASSLSLAPSGQSSSYLETCLLAKPSWYGESSEWPACPSFFLPLHPADPEIIWLFSPSVGISKLQSTFSTHCGKDQASLMAQMVRNPPAMRESWVWFLGWEDPLEEGVATHSSIFAWRIPMDRGAWWATVYGVAKSETWQNN